MLNYKNDLGPVHKTFYPYKIHTQIVEPYTHDVMSHVSIVLIRRITLYTFMQPGPDKL